MGGRRRLGLEERREFEEHFFGAGGVEFGGVGGEEETESATVEAFDPVEL